MSHSTEQRPLHPIIWIALAFLAEKALLSTASQATVGCSGRFAVEGSTLKILIQQYVNSSENAVECSYAFEAPGDSGLLVFANDIRSVRDAEIPGCPVTIYDNVDRSGQPVMSLCGHYRTHVIPVTTQSALVVYKPEFNGVPYTLTLDLEVVSSGGNNLRSCGDVELSVVEAVPVKFSVGFREDSSPGRDWDICDLNVSSADHHATMASKCILTSEGVCRYKVLLSDGAVPKSVDTVDLDAVGGSATVRLFPATGTGVLYLTIPAGFSPLTSLDPSPTALTPADTTSDSLATNRTWEQYVDSYAMNTLKNRTLGSLVELLEVEFTTGETNASTHGEDMNTLKNRTLGSLVELLEVEFTMGETNASTHGEDMNTLKNRTLGSLVELLEVEFTTGETSASTHGEDSSNSGDSAPTIWNSVTSWFDDIWTSAKNTISSAVSTVKGFLKKLF